jgi:hypothetical protein
MHLFPDLEPEQDDTEEWSEPDDLDRSKPLVLLLGAVDHEGITSHLKASGEQYKRIGNRYWDISISSRFAQSS